MKDQHVKRLSRTHAALFRLTGGWLGSRLVDNDILLLATVGARSGKTHTVPLLYIREGGDPIVVASYGGRPTHPDWFVNLVANPDVVVQVGSESWDGRAEVVPDVVRSKLWPRIEAAYEGYAIYQERTTRIIPLVRLLDQTGG